MRLIDADKLYAAITYGEYTTGNIFKDMELQMFINEQPTIQPQGIDKDRLIEFIDDIKDNTMYEDEFDEYSPYEIIAIMDELIDFINQQPTSDGWIPCDYAVPASPSTEDNFRDILIKRKTGGVVTGWYNLIEDTWMKHTEEYGIGDRLTDAVEWKYPQPYKESE